MHCVQTFFSFYPVWFHLLWKGNMYVRVKYVFRLVKPGVPLSAIKYLGLGNNRGSKSNYSCRLNTGFSWEQILPTTYTQAKMSGKRNENGLGEGRGMWIVLFSKVTRLSEVFQSTENKTKFTSIDAQAG